MSKKLILTKILKIQELRKKGFSIPEISTQLNISKSTVFRYILGLKVSPKYLQGLISKRGGSHKRKIIAEQRALEEAKKILGKSLSIKEKLIIFSCLYWAEGSKKDFRLINSDPNLIRIFLKCLRDIFKINEDRIKINVRFHNSIEKEKSLLYWSKIVNISIDKFGKSEVVIGRKPGRLKFGMCRIRVLKGANILKMVNAVNTILIQNSPRSSMDRVGAS